MLAVGAFVWFSKRTPNPIPRLFLLNTKMAFYFSSDADLALEYPVKREIKLAVEFDQPIYRWRHNITFPLRNHPFCYPAKLPELLLRKLVLLS